MTETQRLQGHWWLPQHEDHKVFGTLSWDDEQGGTLLLSDELQPVVWLDNHRPSGSVQRYREHPSGTPSYPLIFGQVEGRAHTLLDAFRLSAPEFGEDERAEKIHVNRFLEGAWFPEPEKLRVDRLIIDMRHLTGWVGQTGVEEEWPQAVGENREVFTIITARTVPSLVVEHADGILKLAQRLRTTGDGVHGRGVEEKWVLRLEAPEPRPLESFVDVASDFQDLVSIAVGHTAQFEKAVLQHPALPALTLFGKPAGNLREDVIYHIRWANRSPEREPVKAHDVYFTLDDLDGVDGIQRWLVTAREYRSELRRVMASHFREGSYLEDQIMNVCAALDSFGEHRRDGTKTYLERIEACVELAGQPFLDLIVRDSADWAKDVKTARHDLAHHKETFRTTGTVGDHLLAEQLFWLFTMCMLRTARAPDPVFEAIGGHAQIRWLRQRAEAAAGEDSRTVGKAP